MLDVVIIGASAAGCSAAIYLARRNINFKLVSFDFGGEMALSGEVSNYPGFGQTTGIELAQKFSDHLEFYKIKPELGYRVSSLEKIENGFSVKFNGNEYQAKTVILATGSHPRELDVPGEKELRGKGLSYCTVCDGPIFKDKAVVIIGGGDSASEAGIMMNEIAKKVYVLTKNPAMKGDSSLIKKLQACKNVEVVYGAQTTKMFEANGFVSEVEYQDVKTGETKTINAEGVFIHIGMIPNTDFLKISELELNQAGEVVINKLCQTNISGLFAAGDLTDIQHKQIGIASGQGICAALSCVDYLNKS